MKMSIIAAIADNGIIGKNNKLIWHLPADLKHFRELTMGKPIIMGRKTFEAIGKPLPGRRNIVISQDPLRSCPNCDFYISFEAALNAVKDANEIMIIGGADIYKLALPFAQKMYLTLVHHNFDGDTYFPEWNKNEWEEIARQYFPADEQNNYAYSYVVLQRTTPSFRIV
jgi:dihydrofolate reductase